MGREEIVMRQILQDITFEPADMIAFAVIIGCFTMLYIGKDGTVSHVLVMLVGYYFGSKSHKSVKLTKE